MRRDGGIAIALLALPWVAALILVRRHQHLGGSDLAIVISVSLGLPSLWLMWTTYRGPRRVGADASGLSLAQVADRLAVAVGAQWSAEAAIRRLNDPYPLPVSWVAADRSLTDGWDSLVRLAASGAGWLAPSPEGTAASPEGLAGQGGELVDVLARVPTGRLVVLGGPGAGKTMLMVRLVLDLLARRDLGGPVPILASVASWNPEEQDLQGWLATQLLLDYPALAAPLAHGMAESTQAAALLTSGFILPILDGLDEIPEQVRGPVISRINDALRPGEHVVVTCRTKEYLDAVRPEGGVEVTLRAAAAVQLRPLDADAVRRYLCDDAGGPVMEARWDPVLPLIGTNAPIGQALSTPLMVALARAIYNPRPGERAGSLRDPAELLSPTLTERTAVESVLFDAFIPAAYRGEPARRWKARDTEKWLVFLARHLEKTISSPDFAWWQLRPDISDFGILVAGLGVGLGVGLGTAPAIAVIAGIVAAGAALVGGPEGKTEKAPARGMRINIRSLGMLVSWLAIGAVIGTGFGLFSLFEDVLPFGGSDHSGFIDGFEGGLGLGAIIGLIVFVSGLENVPRSPAEVASPRAVLVRDRRVALGFIVVYGILFGLPLGLATGLLPGLLSGLVGALGISICRTAWPSYIFARGWHASRRHLPWSLMAFLDDAHMRGVMRQVGAVYQFRHVELQHRLVTRVADPQSTAIPAYAYIGESGRDEIDFPDHTSTAPVAISTSEPPLVSASPFDGTVVSDAVTNAMRHATTSRQAGMALDTKAILLALMQVDVYGDWSRIWLETGSPEMLARERAHDLDETASSYWEGTELTATLASAMRTAARITRQYDLEPMPVGVLALGLIANPATGAARALGVGDRVDHELLVDLIQETLIGTNLENLDLST
jgi:hypothetical protein